MGKMMPRKGDYRDIEAGKDTDVPLSEVSVLLIPCKYPSSLTSPLSLSRFLAAWMAFGESNISPEVHC